MIEVNLATLEKQQEIIDKLNESAGGEINYLYTLASFDSEARDTDLESLKGLEHIKQVVNSSTAMQAVANSPTAMQAVLDSPTAMQAVANSSTAMQAVIDSSTAMQAVANSSTAMQAVANSSTAMQAVANSSTAMQAVLDSSTAMQAVEQSNKTKQLSYSGGNVEGEQYKSDSYGRFLPLKAAYNNSGHQAYNGTWQNVGTELGGWLRLNVNNPIATEIKHSSTNTGRWVMVYDLNA